MRKYVDEFAGLRRQWEAQEARELPPRIEASSAEIPDPAAAPAEDAGATELDELLAASASLLETSPDRPAIEPQREQGSLDVDDLAERVADAVADRLAPDLW